jgi:hypothetical protein
MSPSTSVGPALQVEDQVDLRLAGAGGQQHLAEAEDLQLDAGVLLDRRVAGGAVLVGDRDAVQVQVAR